MYLIWIYKILLIYLFFLFLKFATDFATKLFAIDFATDFMFKNQFFATDFSVAKFIFTTEKSIANLLGTFKFATDFAVAN